MSVEGRVSTDIIVFDKTPAAINVVKLSKVMDIGGQGELVTFVRGTAAAAQVLYLDANTFGYRGADGTIPQLSQVNQIFFRWDGEYLAYLSTEVCSLASSGGFVASSISDGTGLTLSTGAGSGTYTIVALGSP